MLTKDPTLAQWAEWWLETYVKPVAKPSGYEHYYDNIHKHIVPRLGTYKLSELTTPVVQKFLNYVAERGNLRNGGPLSPKSIKNMRVVLDVCCKRAVADGYMAANPVPATVFRHCPTQGIEILTEENQKTLEEWLFQNLSLQDAGIIQGLYSGMRLGEVCAARFRNYDPVKRCLYVEETVRRISDFDRSSECQPRTKLVFSSVKTKSSQRKLPLPDVLNSLIGFQYQRFGEMFGHAPGPDDFIFFNSKGGVTDPDNLSHYFGDVLEGLGLPHIKYHALRHTFASRAVEKGVDVATVAGLLGHADVTTTTHYYVHPREEAMRRAMSSLTTAGGNFPFSAMQIPIGLPWGNDLTLSQPARVCRRRKCV